MSFLAEVSELAYEIDSKSITLWVWEFKSPLQHFIGRYASGQSRWTVNPLPSGFVSSNLTLPIFRVYSEMASHYTFNVAISGSNPDTPILLSWWNGRHACLRSKYLYRCKSSSLFGSINIPFLLVSSYCIYFIIIVYY